MTGAKGVHHHRAKLTPGAVRNIREMHRKGRGYGEIAQLYGVSRMAIRDVVRGRSWKSVE